MPHPAFDAPISPLRQRLIDDMNLRRFSREQLSPRRRTPSDIPWALTRHSHGRRPAPVPDQRQEYGVPVPTTNSIVSALRFFFTHTLDRPDLARPAVASSQAARGAQPRQGGQAAQRHHVSQALGRIVGRLWRGPACDLDVDA
jgi:hypothetical protein